MIKFKALSYHLGGASDIHTPQSASDVLSVVGKFVVDGVSEPGPDPEATFVKMFPTSELDNR